MKSLILVLLFSINALGSVDDSGLETIRKSAELSTLPEFSSSTSEYQLRVRLMPGSSVEVEPAAGGATEDKQDVGNGYLLNIKDRLDGWNSAFPLPVGASTAAKQDVGISYLNSIDNKLPSNLTVTSTRLLVDGSGATQPVSGTVTANFGTLNGAATSAIQTTGNTSLSSIDTKTPTRPRSASGTIDAASETVTFDTTLEGGGIEAVALEITGTWEGALRFEASVNGTDFTQFNYRPLNISNTLGGVHTIDSEAIGAGIPGAAVQYIWDVKGLKKIRVFAQSLTSGAAVIYMTGTSGSINYYNTASVPGTVPDSQSSTNVELDTVDDIAEQSAAGRGVCQMEIAGTWAGTIEFRAGFQGLDLINAYPQNGGSPVTSTTANGRWYLPCGGQNAVYAWMTVHTSGTALVSTQASVAPVVLYSDVVRSALPSGASTSAKQDTIIGHVDGIEGSLTSAVTALQIIDNIVSGNEAQVDVLTLPAITGSVTANAGTNLNTSLLALEAGGNLAGIKSDTAAIKTAVEIIDNAIAGSEIQADVLTLPAITGTVTANAGTNLNTSALALDTSVNNLLKPASTLAGLTTLTTLTTITNPGSKTNNNAAPGTNNVGTLPGVATAARPAYTEGNQVGHSVDLDGATRTTMMPLDALGVYSLAGDVGYTATTINGAIFSFRWGDATRFCVLLRVRVMVLATAFTTAGVVERQMILARAFTASDTGGTAATLTGNNMKRRTSMGTTLLTDARFGGFLTAGTRTLDAAPMAAVSGWMAAVGTVIPFTTLYDATNAHEYPVVFAQNEGFIIRLGAAETASTRRTFVSVDWAEVNATP